MNNATAPDLAPRYPKLPMVARQLKATMPTICDVCGHSRSGGSVDTRRSHKKCSRVRQQRGFLPAGAKATAKKSENSHV